MKTLEPLESVAAVSADQEGDTVPCLPVWDSQTLCLHLVILSAVELRPQSLPCLQVAEDGMNCSDSREELSSLCATCLLHAITSAQPQKMGVGYEGAQDRNAKAKEMVWNELIGSVGTS